MADDSSRSKSLILEVATRTAIIDEQRVELPMREFEVLTSLAAQPGEPLSARELIEKAWPGSSWMTPQDLYWHIWHLRKLIGDDARERKLVANRRGVGYLVDVPSQAVEVVERGLVEVEDPIDPVEEPVSDHAEEDASRSDDVDRPVPLVGTEEPEVTPANATVLGEAAADRRRVAAAIVAAAIFLALSWVAGYWLAQRTDDRATELPNVAQEPDASATSDPDSPGREHVRDSDLSKKSPKNDRDRDESGDAGENNGGTVVAGGGSAISDGGENPAPENPATTPERGPSGSRTQPRDEPNANQPDADKDRQPQPPPPPQPDAHLYHLYNPNSGDHFTTTSSSSANQKQASGYRASTEGRVFTSQEGGTIPISLSDGTAYIYRDPAAAPSGISVAALYRLSGRGDTFYTTSSSEASQAQAQGWSRSTAGYVAA